MRLRYALYGLIALIFFIAAPAPYASASEDTISLEPIPGPGVNGSTEGRHSFWEIPPDFQIFLLLQMLTGFVISVVGILKLGPLLLGKLKKLLENQTRDQIYESVRQNPGSTMADITRREGLNIGTVRYHINQLQAAHKISLVRSSKFLRFFQNAGTYNHREKIIISALGSPASRSIVRYVYDNPGAINKQIADDLDMSESASHVRLKKLLKENIVRTDGEKNIRKYYVNDDVKLVIEKLGR